MKSLCSSLKVVHRCRKYIEFSHCGKPSNQYPFSVYFMKQGNCKARTYSRPIYHLIS